VSACWRQWKKHRIQKLVLLSMAGSTSKQAKLSSKWLAWCYDPDSVSEASTPKRKMASAEAHQLLPRTWRNIPDDRTSQTSCATSSQVVSLLQFNVLADSLSLSGGFVKAPPECLVWDARSGPLLEEITRHSPDIVTMQEVDKYEDFFEPELRVRGYRGIFKKKGGGSLDGCALFVKTSKFQLLEEDVQRFHLQDTDSQVGIIAQLQPTEPGKRLILATTHLKATKTAAGEEIRRDQIKYLLQRISDTSAQCMEPHVVLLSGDLNASPITSKFDSLVYPEIVGHPLGLESAYSLWRTGNAEGATGEPDYTSFKVRGSSGWNGGSGGVAKYTIDYIFYSKGDVRPRRLLDIPKVECVGPDGLPSLKYPSDHLAIMAYLEIKEK